MSNDSKFRDLNQKVFLLQKQVDSLQKAMQENAKVQRDFYTVTIIHMEFMKKRFGVTSEQLIKEYNDAKATQLSEDANRKSIAAIDGVQPERNSDDSSNLRDGN